MKHINSEYTENILTVNVFHIINKVIFMANVKTTEKFAEIADSYLLNRY
jgi:hypothetical protein